MTVSMDKREEVYSAYMQGIAPSLVANKLRLNIKTVIRLYVEFDGI